MHHAQREAPPYGLAHRPLHRPEAVGGPVHSHHHMSHVMAIPSRKATIPAVPGLKGQRLAIGMQPG
ncbi:hypothetical protein Pve01_30170 [Planomonospora venezuelensis]|nr:hypothetical protein Pve01_30170 [Planomonospora venezuelensis]